MNAEIQAVADRLQYEHATVQHILALAPDEALGRNVAEHDWSVRQLMAHLAESQVFMAGALTRWVAGEPPVEEGWAGPDAMNAENAALHADIDREALSELLRTSFLTLYRAVVALPEERLDDAFGPSDLRGIVTGNLDHCLSHAPGLVDSLPEVCMDPLVLNWLLYAEFPADEGREWQRALLARVREEMAREDMEENE